MRIFLVGLILAIGLCTGAWADSIGGLQINTDKIVNPTWVSDRSIKIGLYTSFCTAQALTGLIESAKYGGVHLSNSADNYHVYRLAQDVSWISTGVFSYVEIRQENKPWWAKGCRILSAACYGRNCNELTYRWNVTGSPFNYSDKYSSNKKAIFLIKWDSNKGKFVDFNISGTGKQGALIDIGFAAAGYIFGKIGNYRYGDHWSWLLF